MRALLILAAALTFLAACGKKAPLRPPSSEPPPKESVAP
jgi:predicted small lipoprotein YifL